ncbi:MAG: XdhC/CoxI family protein [Planctomycetota bacterium]
MADLFDLIADLRRRGEPAALATIVRVLGSSPGKPAMKMLVRVDGSISGSVGGGCLEADVREAAREVLVTEKPKLLEFSLTEEHGGNSGLLCGGKVEVFVEPLTVPVLILCGAGHVSKAVATVADLAGFRTTVIDDRADFANAEHFPMAAECRAGPWEETLRDLPAGENSSVVIVTRGHRMDGDCLAWALGTAARYVGMIGSKRKIRAIYDDLLERGVGEEALARVRAPIGLDIGAQTAEEIAVAIVAELIAVRRSTEAGGSLSGLPPSD